MRHGLEGVQRVEKYRPRPRALRRPVLAGLGAPNHRHRHHHRRWCALNSQWLIRDGTVEIFLKHFSTIGSWNLYKTDTCSSRTAIQIEIIATHSTQNKSVQPEILTLGGSRVYQTFANCKIINAVSRHHSETKNGTRVRTCIKNVQEPYTRATFLTHATLGCSFSWNCGPYVWEAASLCYFVFFEPKNIYIEKNIEKYWIFAGSVPNLSCFFIEIAVLKSVSSNHLAHSVLQTGPWIKFPCHFKFKVNSPVILLFKSWRNRLHLVVVVAPIWLF